MNCILFAIVLTLGFINPPHVQALHNVQEPVYQPFKVASFIEPMDQPMQPEVAQLPLADLPIAAQGTYANGYDFGNCTAYVASRIKVPDNLGNADMWAQNAAAQGFKVTQVPLVGAVAQSTVGGFGHVAIVIALAPGQVEVSEMNVKGLNVVDEAWYPVGYFNNYIYF